MPTRIQRKRTKGFKLPPNTLCCTRPGPHSNPLIGEDAAVWFRLWLSHFPKAFASEVVDAACNLGCDIELHENASPFTQGLHFLANLEELRRYDFLA